MAVRKPLTSMKSGGEVFGAFSLVEVECGARLLLYGSTVVVGNKCPRQVTRRVEVR